MASIGLTDAAFRAGKYDASSPTPKSKSDIAANVARSSGRVS
jgi:hypothetical protein